MDRPSARGGDRGGEVVPALRASRVRLTLALTAVALGCGLAAYPLADAGRDRPALLPLAGLGLLGLLFSLAGSTPMLAVALVGLGAELVVHQLATGSPAAAAIGYGAGLLLVAELVRWRVALPPAALVDREAVRRRVETLGATTAVGALAAAATLLGGGVASGSALAAACVGAVGAVGLLGLARILLAR
ncbi:MAG TPA: hypothetical protein VF186_09710 [Gaiellaceae bacterium]